MGQGNDEGRKDGQKVRWQDGSKERKDNVLEEDTKIWAKVMMKDGRTDRRLDGRTEAMKERTMYWRKTRRNGPR
jgi:hypothetical protein